MKRFLLFLLGLAAMVPAWGQRWFLGGTGMIGYTDQFDLAIEPQFGYEITDRWAVGTGLGMVMEISSGYYSLMATDEFGPSTRVTLLGIVEPFVRFTPWHNDFVFIDLKATGAVAFADEPVLTQIGIRPSLRFRVNDHWDIAADLGLFGAACIYDEWIPALGVSATSAGVWCSYRF